MEPIAPPRAGATDLLEPPSLSILARRRSVRLRQETPGPGRVRLVLLPVRVDQTRTGRRWVVVPATPQTPVGSSANPSVGASPSAPSTPAEPICPHGPFDDTAADDALREDILLRLIKPGRTDEASSPLALLLERRGACEVGEADLSWWRAFRRACAVVGRVAATACVVCPDGIRVVA